MLQGAIFDIDGTLIDSVDVHARSWAEAFAHFGYDVTEAQARSQIGKGGDKLLPTFLDEEACARDGEAIEAFRSELFKEKYRGGVRPFPEVRALFQALNERGVRIALASSSKGPDLEYYKDLMQIGDLIDTASSSEDVENSKPEPDIFQVAFDRLRPLRPDQTLVFGDSPWDAKAAGKMSLRTIGMLCGGFPEADLTEAGAIRLYRDPADLLAHLDAVLALG